MGRKPDYILKISTRNSKGEKSSGRIGVAWRDKTKDWISVQLDPGASFDWRDDIYINLYPFQEGDVVDEA